MNNTKSRKYPRTSKKISTPANGSDETEFSLSSTAALSIIGGTFIVGLIAGKLMSMCKRKII